MGKTTIGWTDVTLQLSRGCDPVSPGCANCWAAEIAARFSGPGLAFEGLARFKTDGRRKLAVWTKAPVQLVPEAMLTALSWRKPKRVFVNSVSDLFHGDIPFEYIAAWWAVMAATPHITYQIVTKRAARMLEFFEWLERPHGEPARAGISACGAYAYNLCQERAVTAETPGDQKLQQRWLNASGRVYDMWMKGWDSVALPNVWLLVSTENQETFDERVPHLLSCPAVVHGVSAEPLLGPIDLSRYLRPQQEAEERPRGLIALWRPALRWVIVGGESGDNARPCAEAWISNMVKQIRDEQGVPVAGFVKQLGSRPTGSPDCTGCEGEQFEGTACLRCGDTVELADGMRVLHLKHGKGEDPDEWSPNLRVQEFPVPA